MIDDLKFWITEREAVRVKKEAGEKRPFTDDPMLATYRFCNVHREDDKVTRYIKEHFRDPYPGHPAMILNMAMCRLINWIPTLHNIGYIDDWGVRRDMFIANMKQLSERPGKVWTGAYMITAEHDGSPKYESVARTLDEIDKMVPTTRCYGMWRQLQNAPRCGSFIAAQIVADLKHTWVLQNAPDKDIFCAPGPGSQKGLNYLRNYPLDKKWDQEEFQIQVNRLRLEVSDVVDVDAQDMQNCLCEFFKWKRGYARSKY